MTKRRTILPDKLKPGFRVILWGGACTLLAFFAAYAFYPRAVSVDTAEISRGELVVEVRAEGRTRVQELYVVSAPVTGRLARIGNRTGEDVKAGDLLATLYPADYSALDSRSRAEAEAAMDAAKAASLIAEANLSEAGLIAQEAEKNAGRMLTLLDHQIVSEAAMDQARLDRDAAAARLVAAKSAALVAKAELDGAKSRLADPANPGTAKDTRKLLSPASGRILRVHQQSEAMVTAGTPLLEIGDTAHLEVVAEFLSEDAASVVPGAAARMWHGDNKPLAGVVRSIEPSAFMKISALGVEEQRVNVIIDFSDRKLAGALGDGFRLETAIATASAQDVPLVPVAALFRDRGQWAVYRLVSGRAQLTPVETGIRSQEYAQIRNGLAPGEKVILYPDRSVSDGGRVRGRGE